MVSLTLAAEDAQVLREVLEAYHDSLLMEISHSDSFAFKEMLRARETVITNLLRQLGKVE